MQRYDACMALTTDFLSGDERALARTLTLLEAHDPRGLEILREVRQAGHRSHANRAQVIGVTGAPGAGKSTLTDQLIIECRARGERVAVLAIDPSSPFSGGAILGDRIRMTRHHQDRGVFVRSMASRGALGGLARATVSALAALEAFGFDRVFLETVGVGQSEIDIARVADHVLLILTPAGGDAVQAFKAGIMEIADVFVINKADLPGADRLEREIKAALELGAHDEHTWWPPVVQTVSSVGQGAAFVLDALATHRTHLGASGLESRRLERARFELLSAVHDQVRALVDGSGQEVLEALSSGSVTTEDVVRGLLERLLEQRKLEPIG
jgi:LAO/AO transport system kinase